MHTSRRSNIQTTQYRHNNAHILFNENIFSSFSDSLFDSPIQKKDSDCQKPRSCSQGRGTVLFFEHEERELVLKRYHRGGLLGRFIKNSYMFNGLDRTRMWREFRLLNLMRDLGLPVPRAIAVRCIRNSPMCYQGELIAEKIPNARTLAEILLTENLPEKTWESIGLVIRRFHQHSIEHGDLNACNIMLNKNGQVFLIDFDKSQVHNQRDFSWCNSNLARLRRSLNKWKDRHNHFNFDGDNWQALVRGYQASRQLPLNATASAADVVR